jgi:hypothetical protein
VKTGILGRAVCVPVRVYDEVRTSSPALLENFSDALECALYTLIDACTLMGHEIAPGHSIAFICGHPSAQERLTKASLIYCRQHSTTQIRAILGLSDSDEKKNLHLQVADMIVNLSRELALRSVLGSSDPPVVKTLRESLCKVYFYPPSRVRQTI